MNVKVRVAIDAIFTLILILLAIVLFIPLLGILYYITKNGIAAINWEFLTHLPKPVGESGGGIANAIVGTGILIGIAAVVSFPIGVLTGIYLSENQKGWFSELVRFCVDILQGIPSIVIGIVVYAWMVMTMGHFSAVSGGIALALMMIPILVRSTEETLKLIPHSLKEASLALGVSYWRTVLKVIVPTGANGILTGILLSVSRVAGETAPLLFTAFGNPFMSTSIFKPIQSIPLLIFNYATSPYEELQRLGWGASFVLMSFVLVLTVSTKFFTRKR